MALYDQGLNCGVISSTHHSSLQQPQPLGNGFPEMSMPYLQAEREGGPARVQPALRPR